MDRKIVYAEDIESIDLSEMSLDDLLKLRVKINNQITKLRNNSLDKQKTPTYHRTYLFTDYDLFKEVKEIYEPKSDTRGYTRSCSYMNNSETFTLWLTLTMNDHRDIMSKYSVRRTSGKGACSGEYRVERV